MLQIVRGLHLNCYQKSHLRRHRRHGPGADDRHARGRRRRPAGRLHGGRLERVPLS